MNENSLPMLQSASQALAVEHFRAGRFDLAVQELRIAVENALGSPDLRYNLGTALAATDSHEAAIAEFRKGLDLRPQDAAMLNNLGNSLGALGRYAEAERAFSLALKYDRRNTIILSNRARNLNVLAASLRERGEDKAALPLLQLAVDCQPDFAEGWNNLGTVLHDLRRLDEGEAAIRKALDLRGDYPLALGNLANILMDRGRVDDALALYERAVLLAPDSAVAHWNLALALLLTGDLKRGFGEFEWRFGLPLASTLYSVRNAPAWQGESLEGKRLLIYAEQGLGDTLQFVRYAPLAVERGAEVWIECQSPLKTLISRLTGVAGVLIPGESGPLPDFVCPMMSLPHCFGTTLGSIPAAIPYLVPAPHRVEAWARRFKESARKPRVGLVWAGEPRSGQPDANRIDRRRSIHIDDLSPVLSLEGIDFFSLQKGAPAAQLPASQWAGMVTDWSDDFTDFLETAALVSHLDLVIGVDTSVIHLSGALGKPTWVLSRFDGCWRWLSDRTDSPWYPTLRLFRQKQPLEWAPVVEELTAQLKQWRDAFDAFGRHG